MSRLFAILLLGCANTNEVASVTGPCTEARNDCPNEKAAPLVSECAEAGSDPDCGVSYQAYFHCFQSKQVCDGRGRLDVDASVDACSESYAKWAACAIVDAAMPDTTIVEDTFKPTDTGTDTRVDAKTDVKTDGG
jgi:hypothetical protein